MKLYRFTASNTQKAISAVSESLGPEALVYSTRKIAGGIEVLAGIPSHDEHIIDQLAGNYSTIEAVQQEKSRPKEQEQVFDASAIESLSIQIELLTETIQKLSHNTAVLQTILTAKFNQKWLDFSFLKKLDFTKVLQIILYPSAIIKLR